MSAVRPEGQTQRSGRSGTIVLERQGKVARVTIDNPKRFNAMSRAMWRQLRAVFEDLQACAQTRCVVICGERENFCAGGDISEYQDFRFEESSLRDFHENDVWPALHAMLACDLPIVALIQGNCMGAGIEIAACCDLRLAGESTRFGAPIARLGFPMAPREAALLARELGLPAVRKLLLEAAVFGATDLKSTGFLSDVVPDGELAAEGQALAQRIAVLAPQTARLNKQTLRASNCTVAPVDKAYLATNLEANLMGNPYAYADSAEHREGINAFMEKRRPLF